MIINKYTVYLFFMLSLLMTGCSNQSKKSMLTQGNKIVVLCYHRVGTGNENYTVASEKFEKQVGLLLDRGYKPISVEQLSNHLYNKQEIPAKSFLLTFDDATISDYEYVFPFLVRNNLKAIFFVPTNNIGGDNTLDVAQIKEMNNNSCCDFGSHSKSHRNLFTLSEEVLEAELKNSKEVLEKITGEEVTAFAYPNGFFTEREILLLQKLDYQLAFTVMPGINNILHSPFEIRRITIPNSISDKDFTSLISLR